LDALILEAVYPTIEIATTNRLENYFGPLGRFAAPLLLKQLHMRLGISADDLRPIDHVANVGCPVFIMSGEKDRTTRPEDTKTFFYALSRPSNYGSFRRRDMSIFIKRREPNTSRASLHSSNKGEAKDFSRTLALARDRYRIFRCNVLRSFARSSDFVSNDRPDRR